MAKLVDLFSLVLSVRERKEPPVITRRREIMLELMDATYRFTCATADVARHVTTELRKQFPNACASERQLNMDAALCYFAFAHLSDRPDFRERIQRMRKVGDTRLWLIDKLGEAGFRTWADVERHVAASYAVIPQATQQLSTTTPEPKVASREDDLSENLEPDVTINRAKPERFSISSFGRPVVILDTDTVVKLNSEFDRSETERRRLASSVAGLRENLEAKRVQLEQKDREIQNLQKQLRAISDAKEKDRPSERELSRKNLDLEAKVRAQAAEILRLKETLEAAEQLVSESGTAQARAEKLLEQYKLERQGTIDMDLLVEQLQKRMSASPAVAPADASSEGVMGDEVATPLPTSISFKGHRRYVEYGNRFLREFRKLNGNESNQVLEILRTIDGNGGSIQVIPCRDSGYGDTIARCRKYRRDVFFSVRGQKMIVGDLDRPKS